MTLDATSYPACYFRDGFISPVRFISTKSADQHRRVLENAEAKIGSLHYKAKVHKILRSPFDLATHPSVLDVVGSLIGPDIMLYNVEYIIKEPQTPSFVSWHQDLTYWGFDSDKLVSMWLALSPATEQSGCMRMIPGSHTMGIQQHEKTQAENNLLYQGQTVNNVDEKDAIVCPLQAGEASFHHGWTLHASLPNVSPERRIGLNVQYIKPSMKQLKHGTDSAVLVRGKDNYHHFTPDIPAHSDLDPIALQRFRTLNEVYKTIAADGRVVG